MILLGNAPSFETLIIIDELVSGRVHLKVGLAVGDCVGGRVGDDDGFGVEGATVQFDLTLPGWQFANRWRMQQERQKPPHLVTLETSNKTS